MGPPPPLRGCAKAWGGLKEAGSEFWVLSSEWCAMSCEFETLEKSKKG